MNKLTYKIEFFDYWSIGSGLSGGALADSICLKDRNGLPYIPGKTIKGLFREAAEDLLELNHPDLDNQFIFSVFGEQEKAGSEKTKIADSFFSNVTVENNTAISIFQQHLVPHLYEQIASTALEEYGLAKKYFLRRTEYVLPCVLFGEILDAVSYKKQLSICATFIKRLGLNRHRGYGRCKITIL